MNRDKHKTIRCPRCGKKFCLETNVLQHMNQPLSLCCALYHEHAPPLHHLSQSSRSHFTETHGAAEMQEPDFFDEDSRWTPSGHQDDNYGDSGAFGTTAGPSGKFTEYYEGCTEVFPGRKTFMDIFEMDQYAEERKVNLYFPFASCEEWQFASWILRLRLSLTAIDSLLSLDLVRWRSFSIIPPFDEFHSSSSGFLSRFVPESSSVLEWKLSPLVLLGFVNP